MIWFHGSPHDLPDGTILEPGKVQPNHPELSPTDAVCITLSMTDAGYWARSALWVDDQPGDGFVYVVEPIGPVTQYHDRYRDVEWRVPKAQIITRIPKREKETKP